MEQDAWSLPIYMARGSKRVDNALESSLESLVAVFAARGFEREEWQLKSEMLAPLGARHVRWAFMHEPVSDVHVRVEEALSCEGNSASLASGEPYGTPVSWKLERTIGVSAHAGKGGPIAVEGFRTHYPVQAFDSAERTMGGLAKVVAEAFDRQAQLGRDNGLEAGVLGNCQSFLEQLQP